MKVAVLRRMFDKYRQGDEVVITTLGVVEDIRQRFGGPVSVTHDDRNGVVVVSIGEEKHSVRLWP